MLYFNIFYPIEQPSSSRTDLSYQFKSKIGRSLYFIFGAKDEVRSFDEHHTKYQDFRYESSRLICQNLKANFSEKINCAYTSASSTIKNWEKEFFKTNLKEPLASDMDENTFKVYKIMTHSKKIIKTWNL